MIDITECEMLATGDIVEFIPKVSIAASQIDNEMEQEFTASDAEQESVITDEALAQKGSIVHKNFTAETQRRKASQCFLCVSLCTLCVFASKDKYTLSPYQSAKIVKRIAKNEIFQMSFLRQIGSGKKYIPETYLIAYHADDNVDHRPRQV